MVNYGLHEKLHVTKKMVCLDGDPTIDLRMIPAKFTWTTLLQKTQFNIRTPYYQGIRRKGKQSQEETWSAKKLFNMILENMSTLLPISFCLLKFPLWFPFSGHKLEKPQAESFSNETKVNPNLCFVLKILPMDQCSSPCLVSMENIKRYIKTCCNHP